MEILKYWHCIVGNVCWRQLCDVNVCCNFPIPSNSCSLVTLPGTRTSFNCVPPCYHECPHWDLKWWLCLQCRWAYIIVCTSLTLSWILTALGIFVYGFKIRFLWLPFLKFLSLFNLASKSWCCFPSVHHLTAGSCSLQSLYSTIVLLCNLIEHFEV